MGDASYLKDVETLTNCYNNKSTALFRYDNSLDLYKNEYANYLTGMRFMRIEGISMDTPYNPNPHFHGFDYILGRNITIAPYAIVGQIEVGLSEDEYDARYNQLFPKIDIYPG